MRIDFHWHAAATKVVAACLLRVVGDKNEKQGKTTLYEVHRFKVLQCMLLHFSL
jgi:hypothetical protein